MTKVIAEVANVHEGEFAYMKELVTRLTQTAVSAVKFQYVIPSEFGDPGSENYVELDRLKLSSDEFQALLDVFPDGFTIYFDVFASGSYGQVLQLKKTNPRLKITGVKLHVTNSMDFELLKQAAHDFDTVFISASGLTAIEIANAMRFATEQGFFDKLVLVYGVQNYPTPPESIKLNKLSELKKIFNVKVCLSDHLDGDNIIAADMPALATALGYDFIEKHVTLDRSRRLDDDHAALNIEELEQAILKMQMVQSTLTNNVLALDEGEMLYRNKAKQAIFAATELPEGKSTERTDWMMKRQEGEELQPNFLNLHDLAGEKYMRNISAGRKITYGDVSHSVFGYILVRSASSRFPGKCYQEVQPGVETLRMLIKRLKGAGTVQKWVLCTTSGAEDDQIESIGKSEGLEVVRSSENVYQRLQAAFAITGYPDIMLRITADNVFIDPQHIDAIMPEFIEGNYDYYRHTEVIDGCDFECIKTDAYRTLEVYFSNYKEQAEYMTLFLNNSYFRILPEKTYQIPVDFTLYRFTLDYAEDLENIRSLVNRIQNISFDYQTLCNALTDQGVYKPFFPVNKAFTITADKRTLF